ncbi:MAG: type I methionyl aminopeptidase [Deltaproteobacteria bacterium]|nr:type I methionyl aminopeptidase [Deltaproteobacteria bacterium]
MINIKTPAEIKIMDMANKIVNTALSEVESRIAPGVRASQLNEIAENVERKFGAKPAFKGYNGYKYSICVSVNDEIVHGLPEKSKIIRDGDIVSIDFGVFYNGYFGDAAKTVIVGNVSQTVRDFVKTAEDAFYAGISKMRTGNRIGDISNAIQTLVESRGYGVVRDLVGHGIGTSLHEDPPVPNYGKSGTGPEIIEGMVLAIEPMITMGDYRVSYDDDGWTTRTYDGKLSAHFEYSVAVVDGSYYILGIH